MELLVEDKREKRNQKLRFVKTVNESRNEQQIAVVVIVPVVVYYRLLNNS